MVIAMEIKVHWARSLVGAGRAGDVTHLCTCVADYESREFSNPSTLVRLLYITQGGDSFISCKAGRFFTAKSSAKPVAIGHAAPHDLFRSKANDRSM